MWNSLENNQIPSFNDLVSSPFTLKAGQSHSTSLQMVTKLEALTKYNLNTTSMSAYQDNQLVPKSAYLAS